MADVWENSCHVIPEPRATLQGEIIPSTILKIVLRRILFFCFLIQFLMYAHQWASRTQEQPLSRATMDLRSHSTRVQAPDNHSYFSTRQATHQSVDNTASAIMTSAIQSPRDGSWLMHAQLVKDIPGPCDLRKQMRIATWNVLTLSKTGYPEAIVRELHRYKVSMAGLTECRLTGNGSELIDGYTMMYSGAPSRIRVVALPLDKTLASAVTTWHPVSDRLLYARLKHKHGHLSVVVAYAPTDLSSDADKDIFYQQLESVTSSFPPHDKAVVIGDFNAVSGSYRQDFEDVIGNYVT